VDDMRDKLAIAVNDARYVFSGRTIEHGGKGLFSYNGVFQWFLGSRAVPYSIQQYCE